MNMNVIRQYCVKISMVSMQASQYYLNKVSYSRISLKKFPKLFWFTRNRDDTLNSSEYFNI